MRNLKQIEGENNCLFCAFVLMYGACGASRIEVLNTLEVEVQTMGFVFYFMLAFGIKVERLCSRASNLAKNL